MAQIRIADLSGTSFSACRGRVSRRRREIISLWYVSHTQASFGPSSMYTSMFIQAESSQVKTRQHSTITETSGASISRRIPGIGLRQRSCLQRGQGTGALRLYCPLNSAQAFGVLGWRCGNITSSCSVDFTTLASEVRIPAVRSRTPYSWNCSNVSERSVVI